MERYGLYLFLIFFSLKVQAAEVTIINHFNQPLIFKITLNPEALPELTEHFQLPSNSEITSRIKENLHAYIRADHENCSAFWGVEYVNQKIIFHGYLARNIAFSWHNSSIIFCTISDYQKQGHC